MNQDIALGMVVGLGPGHIVLAGGPARLAKREQRLQFSAHFYCGQMVGCIKMPLSMEIGLGPCDIVLDGDPAPPKGGTAPNFRPMSVVTQLLDGLRCHLVSRQALVQATLFDPAPPRKRAHPPPNFGPCLLWPNGWMDENATWYGSRPRPRPHMC